MTRKYALGAMVAAVIMLWSAPTVDARRAAPGKDPRGNAKGIALLKRVHAAYRDLPAVQTRTHVGPDRVRFTLLLRKGVATAEEFIGVGPTGTTILVARGTGPTYAREAGTQCWRRLAPSDSQSLEDVGLRFPYAYRMLVKAPRRAGAYWLLRVLTHGRSSGETGVFTMRINSRTMLLESEAGTASGHRLTEHIKALARRPKLATPTPAC